MTQSSYNLVWNTVSRCFVDDPVNFAFLNVVSVNDPMKYFLKFPPRQNFALRVTQVAAFTGYMEYTWHKGFTSIVKCTNPTIWSFMDALKLEHSLSELKIVKHLTRRHPLLHDRKSGLTTTRRSPAESRWQLWQLSYLYLKVIGSLI